MRSLGVGHIPDRLAEGRGLGQLAAFQQAWNPADPPSAIAVHVVAGLGPGSWSRSTPSPFCNPTMAIIRWAR